MKGGLEPGENKGQKYQLYFSIILLVLIVVGSVLLIHAYRNLDQSIQDERKEAIDELENMISKQLNMLDKTYSLEVEETASVFSRMSFETLEELQSFFRYREDLLLVKRDGTFFSLNGDVLSIESSDLLEQLVHANSVLTDFITIQTRGDFWIFGQRLEQVRVADMEFVAIVKTVDVQTYAEIASISLYGGHGGAYVVHQNGSILFRPNSAKVDAYFQGYNLFRILEGEEMPEEDRQSLKSAIANKKSIDLITTINNLTWQFQSIPLQSERSVVIAVPVSVTAKETYSQLHKIVLLASGIVAILAVLVIIWVLYFLRRNREIEVTKLQAKATARSEFMSKMSHDIRTPLNAIVGMQDYAMECIDNRDIVHDCLKNAKTSGEYLISIINDVLDMSRIESGKMVITRDAFSMLDILDQIVQMQSTAAKEKEIDFTVEVQTPIETDFVGDTVRIQQCLVNIVSNAIKFTPKGGKITLIYEAVAHKVSQAEVRFTIQDTGIGMSPKFLERIFSPFEQEQSSLISTYKGSGLGLSIVKKLVELMNGEIEVKSKLNEGSTFIITLPLETVEKRKVDMQDTNNQELPDYLKGKRVLLVEDNSINRLIVFRILTKHGLIVDEAENGKEAVEKFEQSEPAYYALIFMDIQMPVMNGLEAAQAIRNSTHPDSKKIPLIALSANAFEEDAEKSKRVGMQAHLAKPIEMKKLTDVLCKYINR